MEGLTIREVIDVLETEADLDCLLDELKVNHKQGTVSVTTRPDLKAAKETEEYVAP